MSSKPGTVDKAQVQALKNWLQKLPDHEADIERLIERIEGLRESAETAGVSHMDGMPRSGGYGGDRLGGVVGKIDQLDREAVAMIQEAQRMRRVRSEAIDLIKSNGRRGWPDRCAVLRMRYLDGHGWPKIRVMLFSRLPDYEDKQETYLRRTHRLHGEALAELVEILNVDELQKGYTKDEL